MAKRVETIKTNRLALRGIDITDADSIVNWRANPEVYKYFLSPHKITIDEHINWFLNRYLNNENRFDWICLNKEKEERIGVFGIIKGDESVELNYLLAPEAQHKGYATEAIRALIDYASKKWDIGKVVAEIHEDNRPSILLAERLGFKQASYKYPFYVYELMIEN